MYAPPVQRLITELSKLPGVGGRTAQRLAFHLLRASDEEALALARAITEVKERIGLCETCFNLADGPSCRICIDVRRDPEDPELLQDMVLAAVNEGLRAAQELAASKLGGLAGGLGGLGLPGM